jgi:hypothetical protein
MFNVFKVFLFDVRIYDLQTNFVMFVPEIRIIVIVIVKNKSMLSATFVNNYFKIYGLIQTTPCPVLLSSRHKNSSGFVSGLSGGRILLKSVFSFPPSF